MNRETEPTEAEVEAVSPAPRFDRAAVRDATEPTASELVAVRAAAPVARSRFSWAPLLALPTLAAAALVALSLRGEPYPAVGAQVRVDATHTVMLADAVSVSGTGALEVLPSPAAVTAVRLGRGELVFDTRGAALRAEWHQADLRATDATFDALVLDDALVVTVSRGVADIEVPGESRSLVAPATFSWTPIPPVIATVAPPAPPEPIPAPEVVPELPIALPERPPTPSAPVEPPPKQVDPAVAAFNAAVADTSGAADARLARVEAFLAAYGDRAAYADEAQFARLELLAATEAPSAAAELDAWLAAHPSHPRTSAVLELAGDHARDTLRDCERASGLYQRLADRSPGTRRGAMATAWVGLCARALGDDARARRVLGEVDRTKLDPELAATVEAALR